MKRARVNESEFKALLKLLPANMRPGTKEYSLKGLHLAKTREQLGGVRAIDSSMFKESIEGLFSLGMTEDEVMQEVKNQFETK